MTTAREIAHKYVRCRGGAPHPHGDGNYYHTKNCDALTADIEALLLAGIWQPIETAPTDGTPVLGYVPWSCSKAKMGTMCFERGGWICSRDNNGGVKFVPVPPTHWRPLPEPPHG